jgi:hypothetical protein
MMSRLQKISEEYNVAIFITNQMTADPGASLSFQVLSLLVINWINQLQVNTNKGTTLGQMSFVV